MADSTEKFNFQFDGQAVEARAGDTVASALYRAGRRIFTRSFKYHRPRGLLCMVGKCPNCMMNVDGAPNVRTVGVFRHELGHILGLRHEHIRAEAGGVCTEGTSFRALTPYDSSSVMHYPWCNGVTTTDLSITASDTSGARQLYGAPVTHTFKDGSAWMSGWCSHPGATFGQGARQGPGGLVELAGVEMGDSERVLDLREVGRDLGRALEVLGGA